MTRLDKLLSNSGSRHCSVLLQFDPERKKTVPWDTYLNQFSDSLCKGSGQSCHSCPAKWSFELNQLLGIEPDEQIKHTQHQA